MTTISTLASHAAKLVQRVQQGLSKLEIVYATHDRWPLPTRSEAAPTVLRISVLDSSFNPPTRAHLALVNTRLPPVSDSSSASSDDYDARLLLLSVRNVDKSLKPSDATYIQRLEMMARLEADILSNSSSHEKPNVAVAILNEPTFVGKSTVLLDFLHRHLSSLLPPKPGPMVIATRPHVELTFLVGFDTLERLFAPRYYSSEEAMEKSLSEFFSPNHHDCRIVCAHRIMQGLAVEQMKEAQEREDATMGIARRLTEPARIALVDIGEREQTMSSSEVRHKRLCGDEGWKDLVTENIRNYIEEKHLYENF